MQQQLDGLAKHLHNMFLAGAIMGGLCCFARPDFNLPLYAFMYLMWDTGVVSCLAGNEARRRPRR